MKIRRVLCAQDIAFFSANSILCACRANIEILNLGAEQFALGFGRRINVGTGSGIKGEVYAARIGGPAP
jgi:hypothetical protein